MIVDPILIAEETEMQRVDVFLQIADHRRLNAPEKNVHRRLRTGRDLRVANEVYA